MAEEKTKIKPLFLWQQKISQLVEPIPGHRMRHVVGDQSPLAGSEASHHPGDDVSAANEPWVNITREDLIKTARSSDPWKRVAVVCDGGLGKTTALQFMEQQLSDQFGTTLAFRLSIGDLPAPAKMIDRLNTILQDHTGQQNGSFKWRLEQRLREGRITLFVDALDQLNKLASRQIQRLHTLLHIEPNWKNCPIWITGRPYAFDRHWSQVIRQSDPWQFLRIEPLEMDAVRSYYRHVKGQELAEELPGEVEGLLKNPRLLKLMSAFSPETIQKLDTPAKVYATAYFTPNNPEDDDDKDSCGLIAMGLKAAGAEAIGLDPGEKPRQDLATLKKQIDRVAEYFGSLAFAMFADSRQEPNPNKEYRRCNTPQPNTDFINKGLLEDFKTKQWRRLFLEAKCRKAAVFNREIQRLHHLDEGSVNFQFLQANDEEAIKWNNPTVQAFFAAWWAVNRATPEQAKLLEEWVLDIYNPATEPYREFWRFATEMPVERSQPDQWIQAMRPLYVPPRDDKGRPIRSCEMLFRSWQRIDRLKSETKHAELVKHWRDGVWTDFKADYKKKWDKDPVLLQLEEGFVHLPGGVFKMGDETGDSDEKPAHRVRVKSFQMHRYAVCNLEYECFDPYHRTRRWYETNDGRDDNSHPLAEKRPGGDDRCPVVNVDWYMSWSFAQWCGSRLPSEPQWEYACRKLQAGTTPEPYNIQGHVGKKLHSDYCNFNGQERWNSRSRSLGKGRGHTIPVDALGENEAGLWQMHGNVWDWCWDGYSNTIYAWRHEHAQNGVYADRNGTDILQVSQRVLRGGSWYSDADGCRSAYRGRNTPVNRYNYYGFRLSRTVSV